MSVQFIRRFAAGLAIFATISASNCFAQTTSDSAIDASNQLLKAKWRAFFARDLKAWKTTSARTSLPAPMRAENARESSQPFVPPPESEPVDGVHQLRVSYAGNVIGEDKVYLRSYNGNLVGPTIRASPGDTIRVHLANELPIEPPHSGDHNSLHGFTSNFQASNVLFGFPGTV